MSDGQVQVPPGIKCGEYGVNFSHANEDRTGKGGNDSGVFWSASVAEPEWLFINSANVFSYL